MATRRFTALPDRKRRALLRGMSVPALMRLASWGGVGAVGNVGAVGGAGALAALVGACSGGGGAEPVSSAATACDAVLDLGKAPAGAVSVRDAGARGDGRTDDTAALQRALDGLASGQWLVFPAGIYPHSARLVIRQRNVTLDGRGATLHATNPDDQALLVQASEVRVAGFTLTAETMERRSAPWHCRIAAWREGAGLAPLSGVQILANQIVESGAPGTRRANSASAAGILVDNTRAFVVAGNVVRRSLADGIQVTGGSRQGQVVLNTVRESGDDMVSVVSYLGEITEAPAALARELASRRESRLVQDMLIARNDVSGAYWGRGIAVVGGENITILGNTIDRCTHGAGIYIAREPSFVSFGVRNVRVESNVVTRVQTASAAYTVLPPPERDARAGHGAIELSAFVFDDEAALPALKEALDIRGVRLAGNRVEEASTPGIRIGYGWGEHDTLMTEGPGGNPLSRGYAGARINEVDLSSNRLAAVAEGLRVYNAADAALVLDCADNLLESLPLTHPSCGARRVAVTGWSPACALAATPR